MQYIYMSIYYTLHTITLKEYCFAGLDLIVYGVHKILEMVIYLYSVN